MRILQITFAVSEKDAGSILADLADRVSNLNFEVIQRVPFTKNMKRRKNGKKPHRATGPRVDTQKKAMKILGYVDSVFRASDAAEAMNKNGLEGKGVSSFLFRQVKYGNLKKVGKGEYEKVQH